MTNIRTNYVSFHPSNWNSSKTHGQTTIQFIPSYWNLRKTDGHTTFHFTPFVDLDRQTIKARFISSLILGSKQDRRTNYVSFYPWYWDRRQTDGQTLYNFTPEYGVKWTRQVIYFVCHAARQILQNTEGQRKFNFTSCCRFDKQSDKLIFISTLILGSKTDRRTNYVIFHPAYWNPRKTDGRLHVISPLIMGSTKDRRTHYASCHPPIEFYARQTDGQTSFYVTLHIRIQIRQTDILLFLSSPILESKQDR